MSTAPLFLSCGRLRRSNDMEPTHKAGFGRRRKRRPIAEFFYALRYRIGEYCVRGFVAALPWIPSRILQMFTTACAWTSFRVLWKYRDRMERNLALTLGDVFDTPKKRRELIWQAWKNFAQGVLDTSICLHLTNEQVISRMSIEGEENLRRALAKRRGVIALSAHLGSFTLIGTRLAASGYAFSVVVKQPRDARFTRMTDAYRARIGMKTISAKPRRHAVRGILKALRDNEVVLVIADEFKSGGIPVNFLGQIAPAPRGPATLAQRTGAPTLPMHMTRRPDGGLLLSIGPEIELIQSEDVEKSVAANTALFARHLEAMVRRFPDQWNWLGFSYNGKRPRLDRRRLAAARRRRRRRQLRP